MQSYASHAHHPVPTYIASVLWLLAAIAFVGTLAFGWDARDSALGWLLAAVLVLIAIGRTYTTKLQDRIIMLEMKVRCAEVLAAGEDAKLARLSPKQIVALRFASDEELGALLDRAVTSQLSPNDIKKAIAAWRPDHHRT
ncbi:MAG: hypothetical protein IT179_03320 [Acidobacteria bacterium]|nr:hypothetical protein [Acidobacteriota bacterium]